MNRTFRCSATIGRKKQLWDGELEVLRCDTTCEAIVRARGSYFHLIAGSHQSGNYICIPNLSIGSELASFDDIFWNWERLKNHTKLGTVDAYSIAFAIKEIGTLLT